MLIKNCLHCDCIAMLACHEFVRNKTAGVSQNPIRGDDQRFLLVIIQKGLKAAFGKKVSAVFLSAAKLQTQYVWIREKQVAHAKDHQMDIKHQEACLKAKSNIFGLYLRLRLTFCGSSLT